MTKLFISILEQLKSRVCPQNTLVIVETEEHKAGQANWTNNYQTTYYMAIECSIAVSIICSNLV